MWFHCRILSELPAVKRICFISLIGVSLFVGYAQMLPAYEIETHSDMSREAANASVLKDTSEGSVLRALGLSYPINEDVKQVFPNSKTGEKKSVLELIRDGARFEDGSSRSVNHFFDPVNNKALLVDGKERGQKSPDWALEDAGPLSEQEFSYRDARAYFYSALTEPSKAKREKNFGLTFQTLGQVIHHLQDMAQPQHVRNDPHCDRWYCVLAGLHNPSRYEKYTDERRGSLPFLPAYASVYSGDDPTTFNIPRTLWHTGNGKGIADYTNRGFVSAGTNFDIIFYPSPVRDLSSAWDADIADLFAAIGKPVPTGPDGKPLSGKMTFLRNTVTDKYRPSSSKVNDKASTYSIFDADLTKYNKTYTYYDFWGKAHTTNKVFTLNRFNFDAAHEFLIPRAVGYSAGLINYFFRGKLDFVPDMADSTKYVIKNQGQEPMDGTFTLYYDDQNDIRHIVPGASWSLAIAKNGESVPLSFTSPTDPAPKNNGEYMLVFRGALGQEANAVVGRSVNDPLVIVGYSNSSIGQQAFRWTQAGGMKGLGFLDGDTRSYAYGVSADGKVVVGESRSSYQAFRWTQSGGMIGLGFLLGGYDSTAYGVSADGSVVVGGSNSSSSRRYQAFRWTSDGMTGLGFLPGDAPYRSIATGVSADGSVVVGRSEGINSNNQAFRWTESGGMVGLGYLVEPGAYYSTANAVSADGKVVVGMSLWTVGEISSYEFGEYKRVYALYLNRQQAFRWTSSGGMEGLINLESNISSSANGVSADGSVVVGSVNNRGEQMGASLIEIGNPGGYGNVTYPTPSVPGGDLGVGLIYAAYRLYEETAVGGGRLAVPPPFNDPSAIAAYNAYIQATVVTDAAYGAARKFYLDGRQAYRDAIAAVGSQGILDRGGLPSAAYILGIPYAGYIKDGAGAAQGAHSAAIAAEVTARAAYFSALDRVDYEEAYLSFPTQHFIKQTATAQAAYEAYAVALKAFAAARDASGVDGFNSKTQAFRWTSDGMKGVGFLPGGAYSEAYGVSTDGSVVVGRSGSSSGTQAFRWTQAGGVVGLGFLPGGTYSQAYGVK